MLLLKDILAHEMKKEKYSGRRASVQPGDRFPRSVPNTVPHSLRLYPVF